MVQHSVKGAGPYGGSPKVGSPFLAGRGRIYLLTLAAGAQAVGRV